MGTKKVKKEKKERIKVKRTKVKKVKCSNCANLLWVPCRSLATVYHLHSSELVCGEVLFNSLFLG